MLVSVVDTQAMTVVTRACRYIAMDRLGCSHGVARKLSFTACGHNLFKCDRS